MLLFVKRAMPGYWAGYVGCNAEPEEFALKYQIQSFQKMMGYEFMKR